MLEQVSAHGTGAEPPPSLGSAVRKLGRLFEEAGLGSPQLDARILVAEACGRDASRLILDRDAAVSADEAARIASFAARRLGGEPVSRILGRREFWGLSFNISPDTLDPRPETEVLVETVLSHAKARGLGQAPLRILDLGTGSGCILGALLSELPQARGTGLDRSEAALAVARANLSRLGLRDRVSFLCGDWMSAIGGGAFDVIVCNPPYIAPSEICQLGLEVRAQDPYLALDGGEDGLEAYRIIVPQAFAGLRKGGLLVFEVGHRQSETVLDLMEHSAPAPGFSAVRILPDLGGAGRAVAAVRQS
jgi:release factor glutamine methyltransferase